MNGRVVRAVTLVLYILAMLGILGLCVIGFTQTANIVVTENGTQFTKDGKGDVCSSEPFSSNLPIRFQYVNNQNVDQGVLQCAWATWITVVRSILTISTLPILCVAFFFNFLRKSRLTYVFLATFVGIGVALCTIASEDIKSIHNGLNFLEKTMPTYAVPGLKIESNVGYFNATPVLDIFDAAVLFLLSVSMFLYQCTTIKPKDEVSSKKKKKAEEKPLIANEEEKREKERKQSEKERKKEMEKEEKERKKKAEKEKKSSTKYDYQSDQIDFLNEQNKSASVPVYKSKPETVSVRAEEPKQSIKVKEDEIDFSAVARENKPSLWG